MRFAVRARNLGKHFAYNRSLHWRGMREALETVARTPFRMLSSSTPTASTTSISSSSAQRAWVFRKLAFDIAPGEVVGLLGANGAGKSVLLKVLARVTAPTEGTAQICGRAAALLEVGAGFHPDLSGRQNVYFNGVLLGMERAKVRRKFDEIVEFSEVGRYIDMPIKLYSSGMRMRLAFSVASHLEPEILIIDEAFSVGDAAFRGKCERKLLQFVSNGCTVILVSHELATVSKLCTRAMLLHSGRLVADGKPADVLEQYLRLTPRVKPESISERQL